MTDDTLNLLVKKFVNQTLVFGNFLLGRVLKNHPEASDSEEVKHLRTLIRELKEEEEHL